MPRCDEYAEISAQGKESLEHFRNFLNILGYRDYVYPKRRERPVRASERGRPRKAFRRAKRLGEPSCGLSCLTVERRRRDWPERIPIPILESLPIAIVSGERPPADEI